MNELIQFLIGYGVELLLGVLTAVAIWALNTVREWVGLSKDNELFKTLDGEIRGALDTAGEKLLELGKRADFETRHEWLNETAQVLARQAPKTLKRTGLSADQLAERIRGRMYERLGKTS